LSNFEPFWVDPAGTCDAKGPRGREAGREGGRALPRRRPAAPLSHPPPGHAAGLRSRGCAMHIPGRGGTAPVRHSTPLPVESPSLRKGRADCGSAVTVICGVTVLLPFQMSFYNGFTSPVSALCKGLQAENLPFLWKFIKASCVCKGLDRDENSFMPVHTGSGDELCDTPMCSPVHSDSIPNTSL
jgi:hypothetical protein